MHFMLGQPTIVRIDYLSSISSSSSLSISAHLVATLLLLFFLDQFLCHIFPFLPSNFTTSTCEDLRSVKRERIIWKWNEIFLLSNFKTGALEFSLNGIFNGFLYTRARNMAGFIVIEVPPSTEPCHFPSISRQFPVIFRQFPSFPVNFPSFPVISYHFLSFPDNVPSSSRHSPSFPIISRQCPVNFPSFPVISYQFLSFPVNLPSTSCHFPSVPVFSRHFPSDGNGREMTGFGVGGGGAFIGSLSGTKNLQEAHFFPFFSQ